MVFDRTKDFKLLKLLAEYCSSKNIVGHFVIDGRDMATTATKEIIEQIAQDHVLLGYPSSDLPPSWLGTPLLLGAYAQSGRKIGDMLGKIPALLYTDNVLDRYDYRELFKHCTIAISRSREQVCAVYVHPSTLDSLESLLAIYEGKGIKFVSSYDCFGIPPYLAAV